MSRIEESARTSYAMIAKEASMATDLGNLELTFCGHAAFSIKTPGGKRVLIDPFLSRNPACPELLKDPKGVERQFGAM